MDQEIIAKAREAKSAEELLAMAKENDIELTGEQAKEYYDRLHASGELSDDELDSVSGGGCSSFEPKCPECGSTNYFRTNEPYYCPVKGGIRTLYYNQCSECGTKFK